MVSPDLQKLGPSSFNLHIKNLQNNKENQSRGWSREVDMQQEPTLLVKCLKNFRGLRDEYKTRFRIRLLTQTILFRKLMRIGAGGQLENQFLFRKFWGTERKLEKNVRVHQRRYYQCMFRTENLAWQNNLFKLLLNKM